MIFHSMFMHACTMADTHRVKAFHSGETRVKGEGQDIGISTAGLTVMDNGDVVVFAWHTIDFVRWAPR